MIPGVNTPQPRMRPLRVYICRYLRSSLNRSFKSLEATEKAVNPTYKYSQPTATLINTWTRKKTQREGVDVALTRAWPCWWSGCKAACGQRNSPHRCPDFGPPPWSRTQKRRLPRWMPPLRKEEAPTRALEFEAFWKIASWRQYGNLLIHLEPNSHDSHNQEIEPQQKLFKHQRLANVTHRPCIDSHFPTPGSWRFTKFTKLFSAQICQMPGYPILSPNSQVLSLGIHTQQIASKLGNVKGRSLHSDKDLMNLMLITITSYHITILQS